MLDSREPPHGDFVAYVEKIEREQLVRAMQPHRLAHLSPAAQGLADGAQGDGSRMPTAAEAQRVLQMLKPQGRDDTSPPRGAMIGAIVGAALIAFGLLAEGGLVLLIVGAVLLWHSLRRLRRACTSAAQPAKQHVDRAFGQNAAATTRRHAA